MTAETHESTFSRRISPELCIISSLSHEEGAGKAGWPHAPGACAQKDCAKARRPQVQAVTTGLPCAVVYGLYVLSSVNQRLPPSPARCVSIVASLSACMGAPGPPDSASRACAPRQSAPSRPPHPRLTCRDVRDTPLLPRRDVSRIADL